MFKLYQLPIPNELLKPQIVAGENSDLKLLAVVARLLTQWHCSGLWKYWSQLLRQITFLTQPQFLAGPRLWYIGASTSLQGSVPVTVTTAYLTAQ